MKILKSVTRFLFIISLLALFLTASVAIITNSPWVYEYGFDKYDISQTTGLAESELQKTANGLISYFNSRDEYISLTVIKDGKPFTLFNEREVVHLKDVKGLFQLNYRVLAVALIYSLIYAGYAFRKKDRRRLAKNALIGSSIGLGLLLVFAIGAFLNFDQLFLQFHFFSFANDFWMLDPARDYLIRLFPEGFFYDYALINGALTAVLALIFGGVSWKYLRSTREKSPAQLSN